MGYSTVTKQTSFINPVNGKSIKNKQLWQELIKKSFTVKEASQIRYFNYTIFDAFRNFQTCEIGDNGTYNFKNSLGDFVCFE